MTTQHHRWGVQALRVLESSQSIRSHLFRVCLLDVHDHSENNANNDMGLTTSRGCM